MTMAATLTEEGRIAAFDILTEDVIQPEFRKWLIDNGFFRQVASSKFHGCYEGGLYDHSAAVTKNLLTLTRKLGLVWKREESPRIIGMLHDLCKIDQYVKTDKGYRFNKNTELHGHGEKSVALISRFMDLTKEEQFCIRYHMGAFVDKEEWTKYTDAIHSFPTVLYVHTADMIAAHIELT